MIGAIAAYIRAGTRRSAAFDPPRAATRCDRTARVGRERNGSFGVIGRNKQTVVDSNLPANFDPKADIAPAMRAAWVLGLEGTSIDELQAYLTVRGISVEVILAAISAPANRLVCQTRLARLQLGIPELRHCLPHQPSARPRFVTESEKFKFKYNHGGTANVQSSVHSPIQ